MGLVTPVSALPGLTAVINVSAEIALLDAGSRITCIQRPAALHLCAAVGACALDRRLMTLRSVFLGLRGKRKDRKDRNQGKDDPGRPENAHVQISSTATLTIPNGHIGSPPLQKPS